ncbi:MAG: hypothetical protein HGA47_02625 [Zoogloea sp.]|nr:hypothetical protein [Zoogloea sp.]
MNIRTHLRRLPAALLLSAFAGSASAMSMEVGQAVINSSVAAKFPKEKMTITFLNPVVSFSKDRQRAALCGNWISKYPAHAGTFCVDARPAWDKAHGDVVITGVQTTKVDMDGDVTVSPIVLKAINASLLPLLDGTSIYHAPSLIGKMVEKIGVSDTGVLVYF